MKSAKDRISTSLDRFSSATGTLDSAAGVALPMQHPYIRDRNDREDEKAVGKWCSRGNVNASRWSLLDIPLNKI